MKTRSALLLVALGLGAGACSRSQASSQKAAADVDAGAAHAVLRIDKTLLAQGRITTAPVELRAPRGELRVPGEVRSSESGSAEAGTLVSGRVATLEVGEGARVTKGQILAWVDAPEVGRATADLLRARAHASLAARKLERQVELEKQQATSKNALDDARADDQAARADLLAARTLLANLGGREPPPDSERTTAIVRVPVVSPIDGVIARRDAVLGAPVSPDKSLFKIVASGTGRVAILARIAETSKVPPAGTKAMLSPRGGGDACGGVSTGALGSVDDQTRTTAVRVEPDATCKWLVAGAYVDVTFPGIAAAEAPVLIVPRDAVLDVAGVPSAFVAGAVEGEYTVRGLRVRAGEGPEVVVEAGLAAGERVVVSGALLLKGEMMRAELGQ